jgi:MoxR-like ATPase
MPSDVTGSSIFNQRSGDFEFRPGPIFANLLLGDEINRAPPKTQAALARGHAGAAGHRSRATTNRSSRPFLVIATQNPIEYEGTYPLPRRSSTASSCGPRVGYPDREHEWRCSSGGSSAGGRDRARRRRRSRHAAGHAARLEQVHVAESIGYYMVDVVKATRESARVQVGASPRGSLALLKLSRCRAALDGRDFVTPDDVKSVAVPALRTASCCARSSGCNVSARTTSSHRHWRPCRRRRPKM